MSLFQQFGSKSKETVYLSVTPGVGLEMIQLDSGTKIVKNYAYRPLSYVESHRTIANIQAFKDAVSELFHELNLNPKVNVVINLPLVFLGAHSFPLIMGDESINTALISMAEQSYVFKNTEPVVSWFDATYKQSEDSRNLFYSALQKNLIDDIKNALSELGANLVGIETSLSSILKALEISGKAEDQLKDDVSWNLMIINQTGYSIASMVGKHLVSYYEEPLAIRSYEGDEIYNAISASAQIALLGYPANYLYIVSCTDMVSAEVLTERMNIDIVKLYFENNDFKKEESIIPVSLDVLQDDAHKISLEAIGVAASSMVKTPVEFNFLSSSGTPSADVFDLDEPVHFEIGSVEFDISPRKANLLSLIIAGALIVPMLILLVALPLVLKDKQAKYDDVNSRKQNVETEISQLQDSSSGAGNFDVNNEIKKVQNSNRSKLMAYMALGESVPKKLWLTYFMAREDGKFDIKGESKNVEDVYAFYTNMKDALINTQLRLHKLQLKSGSIDDAVTIDSNNQLSDYEFEVTNMDAGTLDSLTDSGSNTDENKTE